MKISPAKSRRLLFADAAPFKIDGVYCKLIPLTRGQYAIVDAADYDRLSSRNWHARQFSNRGAYYAWGYFTRDGVRFEHVGMHREVLGLEDCKDRIPDHINGVTLDNRRKNLREATYSQNCQNRKRRRDSSSGFKGVVLDGNKWRAEVELMGTRTSRGGFDSPEEAHLWYQSMASKRFGTFARFE